MCMERLEIRGKSRRLGLAPENCGKAACRAGFGPGQRHENLRAQPVRQLIEMHNQGARLGHEGQGDAPGSLLKLADAPLSHAAEEGKRRMQVLHRYRTAAAGADGLVRRLEECTALLFFRPQRKEQAAGRLPRRGRGAE